MNYGIHLQHVSDVCAWYDTIKQLGTGNAMQRITSGNITVMVFVHALPLILCNNVAVLCCAVCICNLHRADCCIRYLVVTLTSSCDGNVVPGVVALRCIACVCAN